MPAGAAAAGWDWPRTLAARGASALAPQHLRRRHAPPARQRLHCFVLDCSASMVAGGALARAKGVLLQLMDQAYRQRDHVALVCFGGRQVELRLPPRKAGAWNDAWVAPIAGGGGTPLAQAVARAGQVLAASRGHGPAAAEAWLWLLTDGRTRESPARPVPAAEVHVVDFERARVPLRRAQALAVAWAAHYRHADDWAGG